ncbi:histidine phosphatase family protein [Methylobacterium frigidaeris]|nr:histidine phosphatase family protein [Methylobacterium frigidaeris]
MLARSGVKKAYHSGAVRARKTLDPLAHAIGSSLDIVELPAPPDIIRTIIALPETTVAIVVGHSNTVGPIIEGLCGIAVTPIADETFDDLFMVSLNPAGRPNFTHLKYGAET